MFGDLLSWWARQMTALISPIIKRSPARTPDALLVRREQADPDTLHLSHRRKGQVAHIGTLRMDGEPGRSRGVFGARRRGEPLVLSLSEPLLSRGTTLPLAAEANLERVLGYEMDRLTPFGVGDVFFTYEILKRDRAKGQLSVELALIPRTWVNAMLNRLTEEGVQPPRSRRRF